MIEAVEELFERIPELAALTGYRRDAAKEEARRIIEYYSPADDEDDWLGEPA